MRYSTITLTLALVLVLSGCGTVDYITRSRTMSRTATKAQVVKQEVKDYVPLPAETLVTGTVAKNKNRRVSEYVRVANANTPALEQCYRQIEEIRALQPKP